MARQITQSALQAVLAQQTEEVILTTLRIDHTTLEAPLLFVNDQVNLERADGTYLAFPFEPRLPEDTEDNNPRVSIVIDNVDRRVIEAIRGLETKPNITLEVVLKSTPNTPELGPLSMDLKQVDYDAYQIRGDVSYEEDFLNQQFPAQAFTPRTSPGMFQ